MLVLWSVVSSNYPRYALENGGHEQDKRCKHAVRRIEFLRNPIILPGQRLSLHEAIVTILDWRSLISVAKSNGQALKAGSGYIQIDRTSLVHKY